jgi:hypothetical protein
LTNGQISIRCKYDNQLGKYQGAGREVAGLGAGAGSDHAVAGNFGGRGKEEKNMGLEEKLDTEIKVAQQEGVDASELWELFEGARPEQQPVVFRRALEAGVLDDEFAFEMLTTIRENLDQSAPQDRALYGGLLDRFRELDPKLYQKSSHYYHRDLINFAIIEGRWEALPDLLSPYSAGKDLDTFALVIAQLKYHG